MARPFYTGLNNINLLLRYCKNYKIKLKSYDNKIIAIYKTGVVMGQCLKGTYGVFLRKRKLSQTFSIRLFALRAKIAHYVDVVTSSHLL